MVRTFFSMRNIPLFTLTAIILVGTVLFFNATYNAYSAHYVAMENSEQTARPIMKESKNFSLKTPTAHLRSFEERIYGILESIGVSDDITVHITSTPCGKLEALACVMMLEPNIIQVDKTTEKKEDIFLASILAHEMGHVIQNRMPIDAQIRYLAPFNFDNEYLADCMAIARVGFTVSDYGYFCTVQQVLSAQEVWDWYDYVQR